VVHSLAAHFPNTCKLNFSNRDGNQLLLFLYYSVEVNCELFPNIYVCVVFWGCMIFPIDYITVPEECISQWSCTITIWDQWICCLTIIYRYLTILKHTRPHGDTRCTVEDNENVLVCVLRAGYLVEQNYSYLMTEYNTFIQHVIYSEQVRSTWRPVSDCYSLWLKYRKQQLSQQSDV